jgi:predicted  nucleic acid-binding Zn-ribbon protein
MSRAQLLLDLQELDLARDAAVARLRRVLAALGGNPAVAEAQAAVVTAEQALAEHERSLAGQTQNRRALQAKIAAEEKKLYAGQVKGPREVQNLQREIEALQRRLGELDDIALEAMLVGDAAADTLAAARRALAEAEAKAEADNASLSREKSQLMAAIRKLDAGRAGVQGTIRAEDQATYQRLRKAKAGRAVAQIQGRACMACGIELPIDEVHHARTSADLVTCPGCGRILHG